MQVQKAPFELPFDVQEEFKKFLVYRNTDFSKMTPAFASESYVVFQIDTKDCPYPISIGMTKFPKISIETCLASFHLLEHRAQWEKSNTKEVKTVMKLDDISDIIYVHTSPPVVSDRDFCNARIVRKDFPNKGDVTCMVKSVIHPDYPERKGIVRAWTYFTYMSLTSLPDGSTRVFFAGLNDIKGSIPIFVMKQLGSKLIPTVFDALLKYCQQNEGKIGKGILEMVLPFEN